MGIGTATAIGVGGSVLGGGLAAHGANKAASTQANAATNAAQLQKQAADQSLAEQQRQFNINQQNQQPWLQAGQGALTKLSDMTPFQAPGADFTTDPGYQFRLSEGNKAIERSAAARGSVANPATQKALDRYNQDTASSEYGNVYARRFGEYNNTLGQLQSLAGVGQSAAQSLGTAGQNNANTQSTILQNSATNQGNALQNAGTARASGYLTNGNIFNNLASSGGASLSDWLKTRQPNYYGGWNPNTGNTMDIQLPQP